MVSSSLIWDHTHSVSVTYGSIQLWRPQQRAVVIPSQNDKATGALYVTGMWEVFADCTILRIVLPMAPLASGSLSRPCSAL